MPYTATIHLPEYGIAKGDTLRVLRELPGTRLLIHCYRIAPGCTVPYLDTIVLWARQFTKEDH